LSDHQSVHCNVWNGFSSFLQKFAPWRKTTPDAREVISVDALHSQSVAFAEIPLGGSFQFNGRTHQKVSPELARVLRLESGDIPQRRMLVRFDEHRPVIILDRRVQDRNEQ
jgi:hypothetical protein